MGEHCGKTPNNTFFFMGGYMHYVGIYYCTCGPNSNFTLNTSSLLDIRHYFCSS